MIAGALLEWGFAALICLVQEPEPTDLDREIARLLEQQREFEQASQTEWSELRQQREGLASQLLDSELARETIRRDHDALRTEQSNQDQEDQLLQSSVERLHRALASSADEVGFWLTEWPGWEEQSIDVPSTDSSAEFLAATSSIQEYLEVLNRLHLQACSISAQDTELWTARNIRESATLLSAGLNAFAYVTRDDGRVGMAVNAPEDARGFRWTEALSKEHAELVRQSVRSVQSGDPGPIPILADVSGSLRIANLPRTESWLDRLQSGGPVMFPLGLVALLAAAMIAERSWFLYFRNRVPPRLLVRVVEACRQQNQEEALELCEATRGVVPRTLAACLRRRHRGQAAMEDSIQEQLLHELPRLQRFLGGIATLAAVAPLLGLLGTVTGIIDTFAVLRIAGNANPSMMAGGISEALVTTATGMGIAIPTLLLHILLRGRVDRTMAEAEKQAASLLNVLSHEATP